MLYEPYAQIADTLPGSAPCTDFAEHNPDLNSTDPLNIRAHFLQGAERQSCTLTSYYKGVLQITADEASHQIDNGCVTLQGDVFGRIDGEALWVSDRQFVLSIAASLERRAWLAQAFAGLSSLTSAERFPAPVAAET